MEFSSSDLPQENVLEEVVLTWVCSVLFMMLNGESYLTFMLTLIENENKEMEKVLFYFIDYLNFPFIFHYFIVYIIDSWKEEFWVFKIKIQNLLNNYILSIYWK